MDAMSLIYPTQLIERKVALNLIVNGMIPPERGAVMAMWLGKAAREVAPDLFEPKPKAHSVKAWAAMPRLVKR